MSTTLVAKAFQLKVGNPTRKIILVKLADNMNDKGFGFPSYDTIADLCEVSRRSVIRHCQALADEHLIKITQRKTKHGHTSNLFQLNIGLVDQRIAKQEAERIADISGDDNLSPLEWTEDHHPSDRESKKVDTVSPPAVTEDHYPSDTQSKKMDTVSPRTINEPSINHKDIKDRRGSSKTTFDFSSWPAVPSQQVLSDWLAVRKSRKAPLTQTAIERMAKQLHLAVNVGLTVDDCLAECALRGWQGFEYQWLVNTGRTGVGRSSLAVPDHMLHQQTDELGPWEGE
ncbi:helix-turn-helix domain-containing protein [Shewanella sp.]|uniref:helix-turn-helix domain-containing protein n=1 Tax=Shewanella sp. TaxID=50422 RepID=UPI003D13AAC2